MGGPRGTSSLTLIIRGLNSGGACDGEGNSDGEGVTPGSGDTDGISTGIDGTSAGRVLGTSAGGGTGNAGPFVGGSSSGNGDGGTSVGTSGTSVPGDGVLGASDGVLSGRNSGNVTGVGVSDGEGRFGSGTDGDGLIDGVTSGLGSIWGRITEEMSRRV